MPACGGIVPTLEEVAAAEAASSSCFAWQRLPVLQPWHHLHFPPPRSMSGWSPLKLMATSGGCCRSAGHFQTWLVLVVQEELEEEQRRIHCGRCCCHRVVCGPVEPGGGGVGTD